MHVAVYVLSYRNRAGTYVKCADLSIQTRIIQEKTKNPKPACERVAQYRGELLVSKKSEHFRMLASSASQSAKTILTFMTLPLLAIWGKVLTLLVSYRQVSKTHPKTVISHNCLSMNHPVLPSTRLQPAYHK